MEEIVIVFFREVFAVKKCSFCDLESDSLLETIEYPMSIITKDGSTRQIEMTVSPILTQDNELHGVICIFQGYDGIF